MPGCTAEPGGVPHDRVGARYALAEQLASSLQFSRLIPSEKKKAAKELAVGVAKSVKEYVETFRGGCLRQPSTARSTHSTSFSCEGCQPKGIADTAVEFIKIDEGNKDELARLEKLNVLIKESTYPLRTSILQAHAGRGQSSGPASHKFTIGSHTAAWQYFKVRPAGAATKPEVTDSKYCVHDAAHKDYLYTEAWVDKLAKDSPTDKTFWRSSALRSRKVNRIA